MLCINNKRTDVYFNIAAEEYLLKNSRKEFFILYRNEPSVIIGKHQNVDNEIDVEFVNENHIKVVRRYSGGGAVFHDPGNINLTFIENGGNMDFGRFTGIMAEMLSDFGIHAEQDGRRALTVNGRKISGSAQCVYKDRIMYHATLLFSSDLESLTAALNGMPYGDAIHVRSVKSTVANIKDSLGGEMDAANFADAIMERFLRKDPFKNAHYEFSDEEIAEITKLKEYKYLTNRWNYDASDACNINKIRTEPEIYLHGSENYYVNYGKI